MTERILNSTPIRIIAGIIGALSGAAALVNYAFPNPAIVRLFALAGLILVVLYFSFVVIQRVVLRSERQKTYLYIARRYGVGYQSLKIECIINKDGSAVIQRTVDVEAYSIVEELDAFTQSPESEPRSEQEAIDFGRIQSLTEGRNVTLKDEKKEFGKFSAIINISPPLSEGQHVTYEMIEQARPELYAIGLTEAELAKRQTPYDYFGWSIIRPTKKLRLRVYFPDFIRPEGFGAEVRYATASSFPSKRLHHKEQQSLKRPQIEGPEGGRYVLKLDIDDPMIGLIYMVRWDPRKLRSSN